MRTISVVRGICGALVTLGALTSCAASASRTAAGSGGGESAASARQGDRSGSRAAAPARTRQQSVNADVRFMRAMVQHHAQALEMTALVPARTRRPDFLLLSERIEVSQRDEIALMTRWLEKNAASGSGGTSDRHGESGHHHHMPGMLTTQELADLGRASGTVFESRFLTLMVRHHEGALVMVRELFASPGAAQSSEIFRFASDVEADQRAEIQRMHALLNRMQPAQ